MKMTRAEVKEYIFLLIFVLAMASIFLIVAAKSSEYRTTKNDKCYIEAERVGEFAPLTNQYPLYELHPMEDCHE